MCAADVGKDDSILNHGLAVIFLALAYQKLMNQNFFCQCLTVLICGSAV